MTNKEPTKKTGTKKKVTEADITQWRRQRTAGATLESIAETAGRNISVVHRHVGDIEGVRQRTPSTPEEISKARTMRAGGATLEAIAEELGRSGSAVARWTSDITKPKTPTQVQVTSVRYDRDQRKRDIESKTFTTNYPVRDDGVPPPYLPERLPAGADDYDTSGLFPDPKIVAEAIGVGERLTHDLATGRIWESRPIEPVIAMYIVAHNFRIWSKPEFLTDRSSWRRVREFAGVGSVELAERAGISMSSVTRYEKNQRTPDSGQIDRLWWAYRSCQIGTIERLELSLALESAFEHFANEAGTPIHEISVDGEDLLQWIGSQPVAHLTHLARARSFLPYPDWREEDPLFAFAGYVHEDGGTS